MRPAPAVIRAWSKVNLVFDGNSLVAGVGASAPATTALPAQLAALAPVSGVISANNLGVSGQTYQMMDGLNGGSATDVDGAYVAGKINVLLVWEGLNDLVLGRTPTQAIADLGLYVTHRRAANPGWIIVALTTLPCGTIGAGTTYPNTQAGVNQLNADLLTHNALLLASYRFMGINRVVDVRQGTPFGTLPDWTPTSFASLGVGGTTGLWSATAGPYIHLCDLGYGVIAAAIVAQVMRRMPVR